jgi:hypothetical protein
MTPAVEVVAGAVFSSVMMYVLLWGHKGNSD